MNESGLRIALDLTELGARLVAQRQLRDHPRATKEKLTTVVSRWMSDRPRAPDGDSFGRPRNLN